MLQRVGLAQALMGDPDVVVLDEPMSGLDPMGRREVRDLIFELRDQGKTVFFSTHILSDATRLCDRVAILVRGQLRDVGPLGALLDPKVHRVEVAWTAPSEQLARLRAVTTGSHEETSEGHVFRTDASEAARAFVQAVVMAGGEILQLTPHRQTLEELFVSEAARDDAQAGVR